MQNALDANVVSDLIYQHTNAWTQVHKMPSAEKWEELLKDAKAVVVSDTDGMLKQMKDHVYFVADSKAPGHLGYFNGLPVFSPRLTFKSGAPVRVITAMSIRGYEILERYK